MHVAVIASIAHIFPAVGVLYREPCSATQHLQTLRALPDTQMTHKLYVLALAALVCMVRGDEAKHTAAVTKHEESQACAGTPAVEQDIQQDFKWPRGGSRVCGECTMRLEAGVAWNLFCFPQSHASRHLSS